MCCCFWASLTRVCVKRPLEKIHHDNSQERVEARKFVADSRGTCYLRTVREVFHVVEACTVEIDRVADRGKRAEKEDYLQIVVLSVWRDNLGTDREILEVQP